MASKAPKPNEAAAGSLAEAEPETDKGPGKARAGKAAPERRCIVTGTHGDPAGMIRFVLSPDGVVTPDLAARLPGRGAWVLAQRSVIMQATAKGAFSRAFRTQAVADEGLADQVAGLVRARVLHHLGIGRRAGDVLCGFEIVREALKTEGCAALVEAADAASDGRDKLLQILRARARANSPSDDQLTDGAGCLSPALAGCFGAEELGMALGRERVVHACVRVGRFGDVWRAELDRLAGFVAVWPQDWPEIDVATARAAGSAAVGEPTSDGISPGGEE